MSDEERTKWDARWRERGATPVAPSSLVASLDALLPRRGRALDVAGGAGRHAVWLARRGLDVTLCDVSTVAIDLAARAAADAGVSLRTVAADLERDPLPAGPWDAILDFHYLHRPLFAAFADALAPGGVLVFVQPTVANLERHEKPGRAFLLDDGEVARLVPATLEVLRCDEGWSAEGRHEAVLVARRPVQ